MLTWLCLIGTRGFTPGGYLHVDTTETLQGKLAHPSGPPGMPNADLIGHQITDNIQYSPNAIKCTPGSVKSIEFGSL